MSLLAGGTIRPPTDHDLNRLQAGSYTQNEPNIASGYRTYYQ